MDPITAGIHDNALVTSLRSFFTSDPLTEDTREPFATVTLFGDEYGIYAPRGLLWQQLFVVVFLEISLQVMWAAVVYYGIIKQRRSIPTRSSSFSSNSSSTDSSTAPLSSFLLAWGVIVPMVTYTPFVILEVLQLQNAIIRLGTTCLPILVVFRTMEALYDTSPPVVESSLGTYMVYYTTVMSFEWDPKTQKRRKITGQELWAAFTRISTHYLVASAWLSFLLANDYQPFPSSVQLAEYSISWDLLSPAHIANAYCLAVMTYLTLVVGFELTAFGEQLKGYATKPIFDNPFLASRTPTEFWGAKWNLMIHRVLKHGVYLPARKSGWKAGVAIGIAFVVSGLMHDYEWAVVFYHHHHKRNEAGICEDCFQPIPWKLTAFFAYNAAIMLLERPASRIIGNTMRSWPTPLVCHLLLLTTLPVSHWYTGDWALGGFFTDFSIGMFKIAKLSGAEG